MLNHFLPSRSSHTWRFFRAGGLEQVRLETGADLAALAQLDPKLWVALACPVAGLEFDEKTLALIDTDKDGRIRVPEILAAIAFCRELLVDLDGLVQGGDGIELTRFNPATPAGQAAQAAAKALLSNLGKADAARISLADITRTEELFAKAKFNGNGVLGPNATQDADLKQVMADILAAVGGTPNRNGTDGVAQANVEAFFAELAAVDAWHQEAETKAAQVLPLGEKTAAAAAAVAAVKAKVDDYFTRCRLAAFDARALAAVNRSEAEYAALAGRDLSASAAEVAGFPLAHVAAGQPLPLAGGVNPAWAGALAALAADAVAPLLGGGQTALTENDWAQLQSALAAHNAWAGAKPAAKAAELGLERVRTLLAGGAKAQLTDLIAQDLACEGEYNQLLALETVARYQRDLFRLLKNFVSFADFYAQEKMSVFQTGTLFLDTRSCDLCVRVDNAAKHAALAGLSRCFLAYCDLTRPDGAKRQIAAVFGNGDSDFLMVGRNGIFYDRDGKDWDATITKIVDGPISVRQAFFSPYKKFLRMVDEMIHKRAAAAEAEASAKVGGAAGAAANVDKAAAGAPKKFDLGSIALIGVAVSGAAAIIGGLLQAFFGLGFLMPLGLLGLVLLISGPSMLIAALKLRQRNLGPVLDANGWAINSRVKLNIPLAGALTRLAEVPAGAQRSLADPYQPKPSLGWRLVRVAACLLVVCGGIAAAHHLNLLPEATRKPLCFLGAPLRLKLAAKDTAARLAELRADLDGQKDAAGKVVKPGLAQIKADAEALHEKVKADPKADEKAVGRAELAVKRAARQEAKLLEKIDAADKAAEAADDALYAAELAAD